ncbi:MAG: hypothetical protein F6K24_12175 [Okeania sp. SIO2D1]|nr:hypothetical protein [Okeania sp. SIO2D1]
MKNTLSPNTNISKASSTLETILSSIFKLLVIGGIVTTVAISMPKSQPDNLQKPSEEELISAESKPGLYKEKEADNKPVISPYTIILNQDNRSVTLVLSNGVNLDIKNLSNKQKKCIIFGGGLGCIDSLYNPSIASPKEVNTRDENKSSFFEQLKQEEVWIPIVFSLIICFIFFKGKK